MQQNQLIIQITSSIILNTKKKFTMNKIVTSCSQ